MKRANPLLLLVLMAGCLPKLNDESTFNVSAALPVAKEIPSVKGDRKVNIAAKTSGAKVDVFVYLKKDQNQIEKNLIEALPKMLASKRDVADPEFSVTVPANEEAIIRVESSDGKKVEVKLKISS